MLILGNQLFDPRSWPEELRKKKTQVFMREDVELCTYFKFHQHKIIFFLSAMRAFRQEIEKENITVTYQSIGNDKLKYEKALQKWLIEKKVKSVSFFEIEDKFFEKRILQALQEIKVEANIFPSPMFLTSRAEFKAYLESSKKPFMKNFYEKQRKKLKILVDKKLQPEGGQWSFDSENRLPLPKDLKPPELLKFKKDLKVKEVEDIVGTRFSSHPGSSDTFWLPIKREQAKQWLEDFVENKLTDFGPYEDALAIESDFVFHSVLTPFLNCGLLTPIEVIDCVLLKAKKKKIPLASLEGFIRQVIGWREFVRGIYQNYSDIQDKSNFWQNKKKLSQVWYEGGSSIPQLERTLQKVFKYSYCHHIERLMVLGNLMLLLEVEPQEAHRWFMEMFIDSSDWVMGPNVYGMALFSDGGIFATKPYICGSNYWRKMSKEKAGEWCDGVDGLYWSFIDRHRGFFLKNPRLSMMVKTFDKMDSDRKKRLSVAADKLRKELTQ